MKFIDGDFFEGISDLSFGDMYTKQITPTVDLINETYGRLNRTPILFIETHRIMELLSVVSNVKFDCIIITHNSDVSINDNIISYIPNNVRKIFSQNYNGLYYSKIEPLPIGLERKIWFPEKEKQSKIRNAHDNPNLKKDELYFCSFNINTNNKRKYWYDVMLKHDPSIKMSDNQMGDFDHYLNKVSNSKFIISPPGNGIDCHRNWESIYCHSVPVIEDNNFNRRIYENIPVIFIKEDEVDQIFSRIKESEKIEYNFKVPNIYGEYWEEKIKNEI